MTGRSFLVSSRWILVALAALAAIELWGIARSAVDLRSARKEFVFLRGELAGCARTTVSSAGEGVGAIEAALARARGRKEALAARFVERGRDAADEDSPSPTPQASDVFFELNRFVARLSTRAKAHDVPVAAGECFGFSAFQHALPPRIPASAVLRELQVMEACLTALLECEPLRLVEVTRVEERRLLLQAKALKHRNPGSTVTGWQRVSAVATPGAAVFRVAFTGDTAVLRRWLNYLADEPGPARVTFVEVSEAEPTGETDGAEGTWISDRPLRFLVVIEIGRTTSARIG